MSRGDGKSGLLATFVPPRRISNFRQRHNPTFKNQLSTVLPPAPRDTPPDVRGRGLPDDTAAASELPPRLGKDALSRSTGRWLPSSHPNHPAQTVPPRARHARSRQSRPRLRQKISRRGPGLPPP